MSSLHFTTLFLIFFLLFISVVAAQGNSFITLGSSLTPTTNSSWPSPSGVFSFGFFPQNGNGYAVGVFVSDKSKTVVWTANRDNNPTIPTDAVSMQLTNDGRLILQRRQGQVEDVIISPSQPFVSASMLDNGNFVLYDSNSCSIIWQSFDHPTNTLLPGQRLPPGEELFSSASKTDYRRGMFRLKMQLDGNLVQYPVNTPDTPPYAYYARTNVQGKNVSLNLDNDCRLYLLNNGNVTLQNITNGGDLTNGSIYVMRLDVEGIFRLYSLALRPPCDWTKRWSSTEDVCIPKGFCGVNAFCIQTDNVPQCQCLPGFNLAQSGNYTAGCSRSFSPKDCQKIDDRLMYEIRAVSNSVWEDNSYQDLDSVTEQECRQACLDDCNCEAAFFVDSQCKKQKLPLRFGRRSLNNSDMALVRVSTATPGKNKRIKKERDLGVFITGIVFIYVGFLAMSISVICAYQKRRDYKKITKDGEASFVEEMCLRAFTFKDLSRATNDFN